MLSRQGNKRSYGPDSSDAVRLVGEVAAILSIGAGVIHISAAGDHTELPVMFTGFLLVAVLQIALGALLLRRPPSRLIIAAAVAMTLSSIGLWVLSRTAGLPFIEGGHLEPVGFKDGITKLLEVASIPMLLLLLSPDLARVSLPSRRLGGQLRAAVGTTCAMLLVPALLLGGGTHHSHAQAVALGIHDAHDGSDTAAHGDSAAAHGDGEHGGAEHGERTHDANTADHTHAANATGGHHTLLASAPLGATHEHGAAGTPRDHPTHRSDQHGEDRHQGGKHRKHDGDHDHGHGHGGHEPPEAEPPVSVSYEPEPSVCVTSICLP